MSSKMKKRPASEGGAKAKGRPSMDAKGRPSGERRRTFEIERSRDSAGVATVPLAMAPLQWSMLPLNALSCSPEMEWQLLHGPVVWAPSGAVTHIKHQLNPAAVQASIARSRAQSVHSHSLHSQSQSRRGARPSTSDSDSGALTSVDSPLGAQMEALRAELHSLRTRSANSRAASMDVQQPGAGGAPAGPPQLTRASAPQSQGSTERAAKVQQLQRLMEQAARLSGGQGGQLMLSSGSQLSAGGGAVQPISEDDEMMEWLGAERSGPSAPAVMDGGGARAAAAAEEAEAAEEAAVVAAVEAAMEAAAEAVAALPELLLSSALEQRAGPEAGPPPAPAQPEPPSVPWTPPEMPLRSAPGRARNMSRRGDMIMPMLVTAASMARQGSMSLSGGAGLGALAAAPGAGAPGEPPPRPSMFGSAALPGVPGGPPGLGAEGSQGSQPEGGPPPRPSYNGMAMRSMTLPRGQSTVPLSVIMGGSAAAAVTAVELEDALPGKDTREHVAVSLATAGSSTAGGGSGGAGSTGAGGGGGAAAGVSPSTSRAGSMSGGQTSSHAFESLLRSMTMDSRRSSGRSLGEVPSFGSLAHGGGSMGGGMGGMGGGGPPGAFQRSGSAASGFMRARPSDPTGFGIPFIPPRGPLRRSLSGERTSLGGEADDDMLGGSLLSAGPGPEPAAITVSATQRFRPHHPVFDDIEEEDEEAAIQAADEAGSDSDGRSSCSYQLREDASSTSSEEFVQRYAKKDSSLGLRMSMLLRRSDSPYTAGSGGDTPGGSGRAAAAPRGVPLGFAPRAEGTSSDEDSDDDGGGRSGLLGFLVPGASPPAGSTPPRQDSSAGASIIGVIPAAPSSSSGAAAEPARPPPIRVDSPSSASAGAAAAAAAAAAAGAPFALPRQASLSAKAEAARALLQQLGRTSPLSTAASTPRDALAGTPSPRPSMAAAQAGAPARSPSSLATPAAGPAAAAAGAAAAGATPSPTASLSPSITTPGTPTSADASREKARALLQQLSHKSSNLGAAPAAPRPAAAATAAAGRESVETPSPEGLVRRQVSASQPSLDAARALLQRLGRSPTGSLGASASPGQVSPSAAATTPRSTSGLLPASDQASGGAGEALQPRRDSASASVAAARALLEQVSKSRRA